MSNFQLVTLIATTLGSVLSAGLVLGKMILGLQDRVSNLENQVSHIAGLLEGLRISGFFPPYQSQK